ncbi:pantothenate kinase [Acaryochloris sp. IP29b_bin.148]|uniref:pantothenate kinase n=1 Tax=Acaryochloris sp. IP29b_bin.148 TaxID=2969218 RepID=UPI002627DB2E|nr:pantothenate kinase [Acaryochloris sp. IP29b_bin.148]
MRLTAKVLAPWIGLSIGNSRLHWFYYQGSQLDRTWDTPHVGTPIDQAPARWAEWQQHSPAFADHPVSHPLPALWIVSVVSSQTLFWQTYPQAKVLSHADIPLQQPYPTFGLDRALALWAAGTLYQWPVLVIDAGTAMTYTGATSPAHCVGGAILPGLGLQLRSLNQATSDLPAVALPPQLPKRWALETPSAIQSGILHTLIAGMTDFIQAWLDEYPTSKIVITGGDAAMLHRYLAGQPATAPLMEGLILDPLLPGRGLQRLRQLE